MAKRRTMRVSIYGTVRTWAKTPGRRLVKPSKTMSARLNRARARVAGFARRGKVPKSARKAYADARRDYEHSKTRRMRVKKTEKRRLDVILPKAEALKLLEKQGKIFKKYRLKEDYEPGKNLRAKSVRDFIDSYCEEGEWEDVSEEVSP